MNQHPDAVAQLIADSCRLAITHDKTKWANIRKLPYYEGWLHVELFAQFCGDADFDYQALGIDLPATTKRPISSKVKTRGKAKRNANWYPDLGLQVRETKEVVWVELKIASLDREFANGDKGRQRKIESLISACEKTWYALQGIDLQKTEELWKSSAEQQQLSAHEDLAGFVDAGSLVKRGHYSVVVALVSSSPDHDVRAQIRDRIKDALKPRAIVVRRISETDFVLAACSPLEEEQSATQK